MISDPLTQELYTELCRLSLIDVHTHVDPRRPTARNLADLLGAGPFIDLALATGLEPGMLADGVDPRDRARAVFYHLMDFFPNAAPCRWFIEMAHAFLGFQGERLHLSDCSALYRVAEERMARPGWADEVLTTCGIEKVFVGVAFDDALDGIDTARYVPCLRGDDLVFHLDRPEVRARLGRATELDVGDAASLEHVLTSVFEHFRRRGARAVSLVLPPGFAPLPREEGDGEPALAALLRRREAGAAAGDWLAAVSAAFRAFLDHCAAFHLPLLLLGGNSCCSEEGTVAAENVAARPVGRRRYEEVFRDFSAVSFCVAGSLGEDLAVRAACRPNVMACGHGGEAGDVPAAVGEVLRRRLQAVPQTKQIGYFTGMKRLEFGLPLFNQYRRTLADALATDFVRPRLFNVRQALELGRLLLRDNARRLFEV
ncbi:MAG TPA: hypothetical protein VJ739_07895 [Gemmataceae bacterium]|nr:hypothetical protein [Gemmataceae bacterium]